jgi:hypothetical protein
LDDLERLAALYTEGLLTEAEYTLFKNQLLKQGVLGDVGTDSGFCSLFLSSRKLEGSGRSGPGG